MVRINPGNYADSKKFAVKEYTDEQYAAELKRIEEKFTPLVKRCKELGRAMRIGTNHGSLSDRIMNRFGDTPLGMVESALEFARIARANDFHNFKFSMKASNPKVMIDVIACSLCGSMNSARLELSDSPRRHRRRRRRRWPHQRAPSASARCCAMVWAIPSAFRSPRIHRAKLRFAAICWRRYRV
jgi:hypothetical protein